MKIRTRNWAIGASLLAVWYAYGLFKALPYGVAYTPPLPYSEPATEECAALPLEFWEVRIIPYSGGKPGDLEHTCAQAGHDCYQDEAGAVHFRSKIAERLCTRLHISNSCPDAEDTKPKLRTNRLSFS